MTLNPGPGVDPRPAGNTVHVYIDGNIGGSYLRHSTEDGAHYYSAYLGQRPKQFETEQEVLDAVVRYYRTGS